MKRSLNKYESYLHQRYKFSTGGNWVSPLTPTKFNIILRQRTLNKKKKKKKKRHRRKSPYSLTSDRGRRYESLKEFFKRRRRLKSCKGRVDIHSNMFFCDIRRDEDKIGDEGSQLGGLERVNVAREFYRMNTVMNSFVEYLVKIRVADSYSIFTPKVLLYDSLRNGGDDEGEDGEKFRRCYRKLRFVTPSFRILEHEKREIKRKVNDLKMKKVKEILTVRRSSNPNDYRVKREKIKDNMRMREQRRIVEKRLLGLQKSYLTMKNKAYHRMPMVVLLGQKKLDESARLMRIMSKEKVRNRKKVSLSKRLENLPLSEEIVEFQKKLRPRSRGRNSRLYGIIPHKTYGRRKKRRRRIGMNVRKKKSENSENQFDFEVEKMIEFNNIFIRKAVFSKRKRTNGPFRFR